ncbi:GNAT family N-acetyltransferase [candidate division KSB1 bacterium]|nr:GNAT family N-acetyltransferase [candidate division KSB1 bacterium]RQW11818.1 MAG: GNAT family N-acetyltransferase [candidate division KSB1 bacterium]
MKIEIREITDLQQLMDYRDIWNELNSECRTGSAFTSFEWTTSWYQWYSFSGTPLVFFIYHDEKPVGFVPLYVWRGTLGKIAVKRIDFAGYNFGVGTFIVSEQVQEVVPALMDYITKRLHHKWDVIALKGIPKAAEQFSVLSEWLRTGKNQYMLEPYQIPIIKLQGTWDDYLKRFGQKLRHTFNNKRNQAQKLYSVEFTRLKTIAEDELESYMDMIVGIASKSWKSGADSAISSNAHVEGFYRQIAHEFNRKGELDLALLHFDGKPVAYLFGLTVGNNYYAIDTAYLEEFGKNSPGNLVNLMLIRDLFDEHRELYVNDGYDPYKNRFIADSQDASLIFIFSGTWRARTAYMVKSKLLPFLAGLKERTPDIRLSTARKRA